MEKIMNFQKVEFQALSACRTFKDVERGIEIWNLAVSIPEVPSKLGYGPNARKPDLKAKTVNEMKKTLAEEPQNFILYNNGIMIAADHISAKAEEGGIFKVKMSLKLASSKDEGDEEGFVGHGILNGGHTHRAIIQCRDEQSTKKFGELALGSVQVTVVTGVDEGDIPQISRARNLSIKVSEYGLKDLQGAWDGIKEQLSPNLRERIDFRPNENPDSQESVVELVRLLACVNNQLFPFKEPPEKSLHPVQAYNAIGSLVNKWKAEDYQDTIHLLNDVIGLKTMVIQKYQELRSNDMKLGKVKKIKTDYPNILLDGTEVDILLPDPFILPIIAAFRVFIENGKWLKSPNELWLKLGSEITTSLWKEYVDNGNSNVARFGSSKQTWDRVLDYAAYAKLRMQRDREI
jgi:hypothetical protein